MKTPSWNKRRKLIIPGDTNQTLLFSVKHFITTCQKAIRDHGTFCVALSGGSTPKAIFEKLTEEPYAKQIDWAHVHLFWSDERAAAPEDKESNYHMAMHSGLGNMPIPKGQIHRMVAEEKIEENARAYEKLVREVLKGRPFDLVMLGMGDDGHTASLFPHTKGLTVSDRWVAANFIPQKNCWRMTLTYPCINQAENIVVYVLGSGKTQILAAVLLSEDQIDNFPSQGVGTESNPALFIADTAAASALPKLT